MREGFDFSLQSRIRLPHIPLVFVILRIFKRDRSTTLKCFRYRQRVILETFVIVAADDFWSHRAFLNTHFSHVLGHDESYIRHTHTHTPLCYNTKYIYEAAVVAWR